MISSKRQAIREKITQLEAEEKELLNKERPEALKKVLELISEYEFTASELRISHTKINELKSSIKKQKQSKLPPKYAHPHHPDITWSDRGRPPREIKEFLDSGKTKNDLVRL